MNMQEATTAWRADQARFAAMGAVFNGVQSYLPDEARYDYTVAMDAQPSMLTDPNSAIPAFLTTMIDPQVIRVAFTPNKAAEIFGEVRKGTWLDEIAMFQMVEHVGEVSSYGDFNNNGHTGVNTNWPQRQSYLFQTVKEYGEREIERAGLARLNWVAELDMAAATVMNKFLNTTYFFGVNGLQNYGLLNDPSLSAPLTPATKAYGHAPWIYNGSVQATANEIYADIQALFGQIVTQTAGRVEATDDLVLITSPLIAGQALTATNSFGITVRQLIKESFPNMRIETAMQYGAQTALNPQGVVAGNFIQLIAPRIEGQETGYMAFNEKMRTHAIVRDMSSFKQKVTGGTWGAIVRQPLGIASMVGV